jgi:hypothetical protein
MRFSVGIIRRRDEYPYAEECEAGLETRHFRADGTGRDTVNPQGGARDRAWPSTARPGHGSRLGVVHDSLFGGDRRRAEESVAAETISASRGIRRAGQPGQPGRTGLAGHMGSLLLRTRVLGKGQIGDLRPKGWSVRRRALVIVLCSSVATGWCRDTWWSWSSQSDDV